MEIANKRILVVDDVEENTYIVSTILKSDKPGEVKVKVTPVGVDKPETIELKVKVEAK